MKENSLENKITKKEELLTQIDSFLNDYSNEIPEKMAHDLISSPSSFGEKYYKLKVRVNWFTGFLGYLELAYHEKFIPEDFWIEIIDFIKRFKENHKKDSDRTTKEQIDEADNLLKRAKEIIEKN
ncbi:MAG: hypothetical protein WC662_02485 [Candidatus Paceibacterota bacterium]|jgi:hypothetical protein